MVARDVAEFSLRLGDDALILSQRLCEWCADAPLLEEDIALANVALDYLGRARLLLQYAGEGLGQTEDELAFTRDSAEFRNLLLVELPRGDFAFSTVRQYLIDEFELLYFAELTKSADATLAGIAAKTLKEVAYHHRRSRDWMCRLGLGTEESRARTQAGLDLAWGYVGEFFLQDEMEMALVDAGVAVDRAALEAGWRDAVAALLAAAQLEQPDAAWQQSGGRRGLHTEHLGHMLGDMQFMQRAYPGLAW